METKRTVTSNEDEFVEQLKDLIAKVKAGQIEDCQIKVVLAKEEKPVEDEEEDFECDGNCENCEHFEEDDDPEEVFEDLGRTIGCLVYYNLSLPLGLVSKYNKAYLEVLEKRNADSEDT